MNLPPKEVLRDGPEDSGHHRPSAMASSKTVRTAKLPLFVRRGSRSFRFSGGFASPGGPITGRLTRSHDALARLGVQDYPHASTAVISKTLARSVEHQECACWCGLPMSAQSARNLTNQQRNS